LRMNSFISISLQQNINFEISIVVRGSLLVWVSCLANLEAVPFVTKIVYIQSINPVIYFAHVSNKNHGSSTTCFFCKIFKFPKSAQVIKKIHRIKSLLDLPSFNALRKTGTYNFLKNGHVCLLKLQK